MSKIRTALLAGAAVLGVSIGNARADMPVIDASSIAQQVKSYLQDLKNYAVYLQQLQQAVQQVQWATTTAQALIQNPNLGAAMGLMNALGVSDPLPVNPSSITGLISGAGGLGAGGVNGALGGINGALGNLSNLANSSWSANHVYSPSDGSWTSQQLNANANGIAGAQGIAQQVYSEMAQHFSVINALRENLTTATTPAQRENAMAALQGEQVWAQDASGQLQAAQIMLSAQQDSRAQQDNEQLDQSIDQNLQQAAAHGVPIQ